MLKVNIPFFYSLTVLAKIHKMHVLQPTLTKLKQEEVDKLLSSLNISLTQLPKLKITDPSLPEDTEISDVFKIERKIDGEIGIYYRVVTL